MPKKTAATPKVEPENPQEDAPAIKRVDLDLPPQPDGSGLATWQERMAGLVEVEMLEGVSPAAFAMGGTTWQLPSGFIHRARGSAHIQSRSAELIARSPVDHILFYLCLSGEIRSDYDGRLVELMPGDLVVLDYKRPFRSEATEFSCATLIVDRKTVPAVFRKGNLNGRPLWAELAVTQLFTRNLLSLIDLMDRLSVDQADVAIEGLLAIAAEGWSEVDTRNNNDVVVRRALRVLKDNLSNTNFTIDHMIEKLGNSRAQVYRMFEPMGGVRSVLQHMRMDAALKSLLASEPRAGTVREVARSHGFKAEAHFSRAFKDRYGVAPKEVVGKNAEAGGTTFANHLGSSTPEPADTLVSWLKTIGT